MQYGRNPFGPMLEGFCAPKPNRDLEPPPHEPESSEIQTGGSSSNSGTPSAKLQQIKSRRKTRAKLTSDLSSAISRIPRPPPSQSALVASRLAQSISAIQFEFSWMAIGPSLIGTDKTFDIAALACSQATEYHMQKRTGLGDEALLEAALDNYNLAVSRLRMRLSDPNSKTLRLDFAAATSAALSQAKSLVVFPQRKSRTNYHEESFIHYDALWRYMVVEAERGCSPSEIHRTLFHDVSRYRYFRATFMGTWEGGPEFSPKYQTYWSLMKPYHVGDRPEYLGKLQTASQKIDAKLQELVECIKQLQKGEGVELSDVEGLSLYLLGLQDRAAEDVAHPTRMTRSGEGDGPILPYSFDFDGLTYWPALLHYWALVLTVICLSLRAHEFLAFLPDHRGRTLRYNRNRIAKNIVMSTQYAMQRGPFARLQPFHPLIVVWAAGPEVEGTSQGELRDWILKTLQERCGLPFLPEWTATDLETRAALFALDRPSEAAT